MTPLTDRRQQAIALINQLPPEKLTAVVQLLEFLAEPAQPTVSPQEATLLQVIQQGLPVVVRQRLTGLHDRCEWGELTEAEHQELIGYEDLLEEQRVKRLEALIQLAARATYHCEYCQCPVIMNHGKHE